MIRLSPSKIGCIFRCPREYLLNYVEKVPQERGKALLIGTAFHETLDGKPADLGALRALDGEYPWETCIRRMVAGHREVTQFEPPEVLREVVYETDAVKLIVDSIRLEDDGRMWITENKTATTLDETKLLMLPNEIQCVAYAAHADEIAASAWQTPGMFAGMKYVTTLKPAERRKKTETAEEFGERMTSSTVVWTIPAEKLANSHERWLMLREFSLRRIEEAEAAYEQTKRIEDIPANTAQCIRHGNPCPYFSRCHA